MTWTAYQVTFRLLSPMHIGWRKLGNLQQTRPYVTGRNLWGALTARLTREQNSSDYQGVGGQVDKQLAFTYFYPSIKQDTAFPWPWTDVSRQSDEFAWKFLGSYASTALSNGRNAENGSLHETEFIAPYTRDGEAVYLVGYLIENDDFGDDPQAIVNNWQEAIDKLQLGGERGYGWGRVRLEGQPEKVINNRCFEYELDCTGGHPLLSVLDNMHLLAHTIANDDDQVDGQPGRGVAIEPFLGRETRGGQGYGNSFSDPEICWVPGGKVNKGETFQIQAKGIWKQQPEP